MHRTNNGHTGQHTGTGVTHTGSVHGSDAVSFNAAGLASSCPNRARYDRDRLNQMSVRRKRRLEEMRGAMRPVRAFLGPNVTTTTIAALITLVDIKYGFTNSMTSLWNRPVVEEGMTEEEEAFRADDGASMSMGAVRGKMRGRNNTGTYTHTHPA